MTGVAQALFNDKANGSLVERERQGRRLVAARPELHRRTEYFQTAAVGGRRTGIGLDRRRRPARRPLRRPAANSGGSNLGPTNPDFLQAPRTTRTPDEDETADACATVEAYREANGLAADATVPVDAVTASGSGLDPHDLGRQRQIQAARVAGAGAAVDAVTRASSTTTPRSRRSGSWASRA